MSETKKLRQELAFPVNEMGADHQVSFNPGMSKRFYAACAAMRGIIASSDVSAAGIDSEWTARAAFIMADKLLKEEQR